MPADRRPLRERARNQLRINTSLVKDIRRNQPDVVQSLESRRRGSPSPPYTTPNRILISKNEGALSRSIIVIKPAHKYNTRRSRSRIIFIIKPRPAPPPPPFKAFHTLVPEISVAFSNGEYDPTIVTPPYYPFPPSSFTSAAMLEPFTHIIRIVHPSARLSKKDCRCRSSKTTAKSCSSLIPGEVWTNYDDSSRKAILTLVTSPVPNIPGNIPSLTHEQLVAARDFICLALPCVTAPTHQSNNSRPASPSPISDPAHILITGPGESSLRGRLIFATDVRDQTATDILSIITVYSAFVAPVPTKITTVLQKLYDLVRGDQEKAMRRSLERGYPGAEAEEYERGYFEREEDIEPWKPWISTKGCKVLKAVVKDWNPVQLPRRFSEK